MAKVSFSKLSLKTNNEVVNIRFNDQIIEIKQYISVNDKLKLIRQAVLGYEKKQSLLIMYKKQVYNVTLK